MTQNDPKMTINDLKWPKIIIISHPLAPDCCWSGQIKQIPKAEAFESPFIW